MSNDVVVVRRATIDDYDSVINTLNDLWEGHDYLPTLYHVLLQTQHVFYVAEINGRVVSFAGARITPDGRTAMLMSSRTAKDFQAMGLHRQLQRQIRADFPNATNFIFGGEANDASQKARGRAQSLYFWNFLHYEIAADKMPGMKLPPSTTAKNLPLSECIDLVKRGVCEQFFRRFAAVDYIPNAAYWGPVRLSEGDLVELMKRSGNVTVTYDKNASHQISSLSFSESLLLKTRLRNGELRVDVQYFGSSLDELVEHVRAHLSHSADISRGRNVNFEINFPTCIDQETASATISRDVVHGIKNNISFNGYLSTARIRRQSNVPMSML